MPTKDGPPWRADGGGWGPNGDWGPGAGPPWARGMRGRGRDRRRWRGFGCLFGLLFLVIAGSLVWVVANVVSNFGPLPAIIVAVAVAAVLFGMGRMLGVVAWTLDRMVEATRRVADGDHTVRVGPPPRRAMRSLGELTSGFDAMVERLEIDEAQRRSLLADVSHELRTPLAVITGNLEAILDGVYPADSAHLTPILDETRVLARLIDDLRTVTLSEAGTLALHPEPTDPDVLIAEVVRSFTPSAAAAEVTLTTDIDGDLPILDVDPVRIREVLSNLVANAIRHTPAGGTVTIGGEAPAASSSVVLTVHDTGPGIPADLRPYVFDRFVKGSDSRGSGLGLAIARGLVVAHGGTISVDPPVGGGTTFRVELPRPTAS